MIKEIKVPAKGKKYSMILIVDDTSKKRTGVMREELLKDHVPCVICKSEDIRKYPEALAVFVFTSAEDHLKTVCLRSGRIPVLAVNESRSRIYNSDVLFYDPASEKTHIDFIYDFLLNRFGITAGKYRVGEIEFKDNGVYVGMTYIKLTKTEQRLLALFMMNSNQWIPENTVIKACFAGGSKGKGGLAAVHTCNINKKASLVLNRPLILTKRGQGYILNMTI